MSAIFGLRSMNTMHLVILLHLFHQLRSITITSYLTISLLYFTHSKLPMSHTIAYVEFVLLNFAFDLEKLYFIVLQRNTNTILLRARFNSNSQLLSLSLSLLGSRAQT